MAAGACFHRFLPSRLSRVRSPLSDAPGLIGCNNGWKGVPVKLLPCSGCQTSALALNPVFVGAASEVAIWACGVPILNGSMGLIHLSRAGGMRTLTWCCGFFMLVSVERMVFSLQRFFICGTKRPPVTGRQRMRAPFVSVCAAGWCGHRRAWKSAGQWQILKP